VDEYLRSISEDARHVLNLSTKLKQEVGTLKGEDPRVMTAASFLQEARETAPESRSHVEIRFESIDPTLTVRAVPSQIRDILNNLITNAVEALLVDSDEGLVIVRASGRGRQVLFQVEDAGPGIKQEDQEKIFQFLYSTKGSSGFGLWSAQRKALANGGKIEVKSAPGQGATFTLSLPRAYHEVEAQFAH
jgi:signal transduction histidine kinase